VKLAEETFNTATLLPHQPNGPEQGCQIICIVEAVFKAAAELSLFFWIKTIDKTCWRITHTTEDTGKAAFDNLDRTIGKDRCNQGCNLLICRILITVTERKRIIGQMLLGTIGVKLIKYCM